MGDFRQIRGGETRELTMAPEKPLGNWDHPAKLDSTERKDHDARDPHEKKKSANITQESNL